MLKRIGNISLKMLEKPVKISVIMAIVGGIIFALAIVSNMAIGAPPTSPTLDVNVTNTPNVSVVNTPTVNIGAGSVGITGTPNVNVANTITNPVPVQDVENPARQPFQITLHVSMPDPQIYNATTFIVPSGKRLVIEYISADVAITTGQKIDWGISTTVNGSTGGYGLIPNFIGTFASGELDFIRASQQVRLYADPDSAVMVFAERNSNSGGNTNDVAFSISGYLVNIS